MRKLLKFSLNAQKKKNKSENAQVTRCRHRRRTVSYVALTNFLAYPLQQQQQKQTAVTTTTTKWTKQTIYNAASSSYSSFSSYYTLHSLSLVAYPSPFWTNNFTSGSQMQHAAVCEKKQAANKMSTNWVIDQCDQRNFWESEIYLHDFLYFWISTKHRQTA